MNNGPTNRLTHEQDPLALHQALQNAVEDGQNPVIDENVGFMSDLPLLKSKYILQCSFCTEKILF
jgi:transcription factor AP-2, invertebrate